MRKALLAAVLFAASTVAEEGVAQAKRRKGNAKEDAPPSEGAEATPDEGAKPGKRRRKSRRSRGAPPPTPGQPPVQGRAPQAMGYFTVVRVDRAAETVTINGGTSHGLRAQQLVCFLNDFRETLACERVETVARSSATVKIQTKPINLFKAGLPARPATAAEVAAYGAQTSGGYGPFIHVGYVYSVLLPFSYRAVGFNPELRDVADSNPWLQDKKAASGAAQGQLLAQLPLSPTLGLAVGVIGRSLPTLTTKGAYDPSDGGALFESKTDAMALAMPITIRWLAGPGPVHLMLGEGFQIDHSTVRYRAYGVSGAGDDRKQIASYVSVLNTVSLRGDVGAAFKIGQASTFSIAAGLVIPFATFGKSKVGRFDMPNGDNGEAQEQDLAATIAHDRAKVGVDVALTLSIGL